LRTYCASIGKLRSVVVRRKLRLFFLPTRSTLLSNDLNVYSPTASNSERRLLAVNKGICLANLRRKFVVASSTGDREKRFIIVTCVTPARMRNNYNEMPLFVFPTIVLVLSIRSSPYGLVISVNPFTDYSRLSDERFGTFSRRRFSFYVYRRRV